MPSGESEGKTATIYDSAAAETMYTPADSSTVKTEVPSSAENPADSSVAMPSGESDGDTARIDDSAAAETMDTPVDSSTLKTEFPSPAENPADASADGLTNRTEQGVETAAEQPSRMEEDSPQSDTANAAAVAEDHQSIASQHAASQHDSQANASTEEVVSPHADTRLPSPSSLALSVS